MGHSPAQSGNLRTSIRYMANPMPFPRAMVALACDIFKLFFISARYIYIISYFPAEDRRAGEYACRDRTAVLRT
jgi:hypothetical protein